METFFSIYNKLLSENGLLCAAQTLARSINGPLNSLQQLEFERIDHLRVNLMLRAEKQCRKLKVGGIEFSPKVQHQRDRINLWKHGISKK